ncbi:MAG: flagellar biosynthesis anti-sigma factor FlgM [bacterium]|nr:flagellar biosynthesis anti-sigma factor FlgM [bacterium]
MKIYENEELKRLLRIYLSREAREKPSLQPKSYDKVEISKEGETLARIFTAMSNIGEPDIQEKLDAIKREIEEGRYNIAERVLAERMLSGDIPEDIIKIWLGE